MKLAIGFCNRDADQFMRWGDWVYSNQGIGIPIVVLTTDKTSQSATRAGRRMGMSLSQYPTWKVVPHVEGWPQGPNSMFTAALEACRGDDMFWMEPDAIPMSNDWVDLWMEEWETRKPYQHFMGGLVEHYLTHMTGVGIYSRDWMVSAPSLATATDMAWDVHAAHEVMPRAKFTKLIQHVFPGPASIDIGTWDGESCIFHQDKAGQFIKLLKGSLPPKPKKKQLAYRIL